MAIEFNLGNTKTNIDQDIIAKESKLNDIRFPTGTAKVNNYHCYKRINNIGNNSNESYVLNPNLEYNGERNSIVAVHDIESFDETIHSSDENSVNGMPIMDSEDHQKVVELINHIPNKIKVQKLFNNQKPNLTVQISEADTNNDKINIIKEYINPDTKYYYNFQHDLYFQFDEIIQSIFKNSSIKLLKYTKILIDVENSYDQIQSNNTELS